VRLLMRMRRRRDLHWLLRARALHREPSTAEA
jgi:hypothetical protein